MVMIRDISDAQMAKIADYGECARQMGLWYWNSSGWWNIAEDKVQAVHFGTYMDDFYMEDFLERIGISYTDQIPEENENGNEDEDVWWFDDEWKERWNDVTEKAARRDKERYAIEKDILPKALLGNVEHLPEFARLCEQDPDIIWRALHSPKTMFTTSVSHIPDGDNEGCTCLSIRFPDPIPGECFFSLLFFGGNKETRYFNVEKPIGDNSGNAVFLELKIGEDFRDNNEYHSYGTCSLSHDEAFRRAKALFEGHWGHEKVGEKFYSVEKISIKGKDLSKKQVQDIISYKQRAMDEGFEWYDKDWKYEHGLESIQDPAWTIEYSEEDRYITAKRDFDDGFNFLRYLEDIVGVPYDAVNWE